jgi:hypothetical protein
LVAYLERRNVAPGSGAHYVATLAQDASAWRKVEYDVFGLHVAELESAEGPEFLLSIDFEDADASLRVLLGIVACSLHELQEHLATSDYKRRINTAVGEIVRSYRFALAGAR